MAPDPSAPAPEPSPAAVSHSAASADATLKDEGAGSVTPRVTTPGRVERTTFAPSLLTASRGTVLYVHDGEDWVRGSERSMLQVIEFMDQRRFRPVVWCTTEAMADAARAVRADVIMGRGWHEAAAARWPDRALVRESLDIIRRYDVRLVHANVIDPVKWLLVASRTARVPLLVHVHMPSDAVERRLTGTHQAALVVGVSWASVQGYLDDGMPADRVRVIYNGVDRRRMTFGDATGLRDSLGIPADAVVITYVGSLVPHKAVDVLLAAFVRVLDAHPDTHLIVVGDGPRRADLEAQAAAPPLAGRVHFTGARKDVGAVLRDATDIFASASYVETFQNTLAEAALCGVPAVATTIAPHFEVIAPGETGLLVPPHDAAAMAAALLDLVRDPVRRRVMGEAAHARARRLFSIERTADEFEAAYDALLRRPAEHYGWLGDWTFPRGYWDWMRNAALRRIGLAPSADGQPAVSSGSAAAAAATHVLEQL